MDGFERLRLAAVQSFYEEGWTRVRVAGKESSPFQVQKGVRQGCPLSPWLFNIFIDRIVSEAIGTSSMVVYD